MPDARFVCHSSARAGVWATAVAIAVAIVVAAALAALHPASAQEGERLAVDQVVVSGDGQSIVALVSVLDAAGRPIPGLDGFEAAVDGEAVPVDSVAPVLDQEAGVAVLLMMDISGSMAGAPIAQSRDAAEQFVAGLRDTDVAGLIAFSGTPSELAPFGAERNVLTAAIRSLATEEETGTALYDSIALALESVQSAPLERRAIVLLTDGQDNGSAGAPSRSGVIGQAARAGVPVYAIALGDDTDAAFLSDLATAAGGRSYQAPTPGDVAAIYETIGETLRGQYALTLALPESEATQRELLVGLQLERGPVAGRLQFTTAPLAASDGGRSGSAVLFVVVAAVVAVLLLLAVIAGWRRFRRGRAPRGGPAGDPTLPRRFQEAAPRSTLESAVLTVVAGPNAGTGTTMTARPIELGSGDACQLHLDAADGAVARRHVRAWLSGGRLIVHHLARGKRTFVDERPIDWAALDPGDTLQIGPHVVAFAEPNDEVPITRPESAPLGMS